MHVFSLSREAEWDPKKHVEKILGTTEAGDFTVACWEPGQISPRRKLFIRLAVRRSLIGSPGPKFYTQK